MIDGAWVVWWHDEGGPRCFSIHAEEVAALRTAVANVDYMPKVTFVGWGEMMSDALH